MGSTYALDWSVENVGPTIKYDSDPRLFQLDYVVKPPGATASVGWMPNVQNSINNGFELPVTLDAGGTVSFYKYVSSETNYDGLRFYVDGVQQGFWSGPAGSWAQVSFSLTAGVHTLRWAYTKDTSGSAGSDRAYVALLEVTNVATLPTSRRASKVYDFEDGALPAPVSTTSWTNSTSSPITGTRSLRSPASTIPNSTYSATIAVPGNAENTAVGFDFKRSAESGDRTWFVMDGVDFPIFYGEPSLQQKMGFIIAGGSGAHTLRVDYRTDSTLTQGENATWIDNLSVPLKVRTNLFPYPSGEAALGWAPWAGDTGTTVAADASVAYVGAKGIRFSRNTSTGRIFGVFGSDANSNPTSDSFAVVAGDTYTFSMYVHGQSTAPSIKLNMVWQTATGYQAFVTTTTATSSSGWTRCVVTGTVPAGAVKMGLEIQSSTATVLAGDSFVADGFMLEKGSTAGTYFDGSTVKAGYDYAWTGATNASASTETESSGTTPFVNSVTTGAVTTAANPTVTLAATPAAGDVLILSTVLGQTGDPLVTEVSGLGASWARIPGGNSYTTFWIGTGATSSGTITATATAATAGRVLRLHHLSNVTADVSVQQYYSSFPVQATPYQLVIGAAYSQSTTTPLGAKTPTTGWTDDTEIVLSSSRRFNTTYNRTGSTASFNVAGATYSVLLVVGSPVAGSRVTKVNGTANSSAETAATGWISSSMGSIASSTAQAFSGTKSLAATANNSNASFTQANNGPVLPIVGGTTTVTLSAYVYSSAARTAGIVPKWLGATSSVLSTGTLSGTVLTPNTWTRVTWTGVGPGGSVPAYFVAPSIVFSDSVSGDVFYVDAVMTEYGSSASAYFDGSTATAGSTNGFTGSSDLYPSYQASPIAAGAKTIASALSGAGTLSSSLAYTRTNYCANPSFEAGVAGWLAYDTSTALGLPTTAPRSGTTSLSIQNNTTTGRLTATYGTDSVGGPTASSIPVVAGQSVTISMYVQKGTGALSVFPMIFWQTDNAYYSSNSGATTALVGGYQRITLTAVAPVGATKFGLGARSAAAATGDFFYIDDVLAEKSTSLGAYFDGSTVQAGYTYAWTGAVNASTSTESPAVAGAKTISSSLSGSGTLTSTTTQPTKRINSALSGSGSLTSALAYTKRINSALSGTGTLSAKLRRNIASTLSGSGTLTSVLAGRLIKSNLSGSGTLTSALRRTIQSALSGSGSLTSSLAYAKRMESAFSGSGTLSSVIDAVPTKQISSALGGEGVLFSELGYVVKPGDLGTGPLGKLSSFTVSTSAVQLNPSEGSGSTPSINATYTNGVDPEYALGETNVLKNGAIGTYEGEVVKVGTSQSSGRASISMNTALTPLNVELHLFPFIDGVPGLGTAARAIDYWTQQCGLFYDKVPGQCVAYASGFGHVDAFGAGTTARFYERLTGGTTSTRVVNGRSVRTLGAAVTGTTKFHEAKDETVRVTLPKNRKLVFSTGLGLSGSGRMGTVEWSFLDPKDVRRTVTLTGTSDGGVSASIDGATALSASVPAGGSYRLAFSLERVSTTALVGKLTVHTDDLEGSGDLVYASSSTVIGTELSSILRLTSITHSSAGGAGTEMTRWGTYLTVADRHPMEVPAIQKVLGQSKKPFEFVSGFTGNVWNLLNEFCSIARLEVRFIDGALHIEPRNNAIAAPGTSWARFDVDRQRREKYKQVAVVNKQSKAVTTDDAVLWRADSVYQVAAREVFETTVQTGHSILNVVNPVAVSGITPFPYKKGAGQYVVTGADGYIIAPAWWNDNGGKIEVSLTGVEGEIAIKITAPALETVRAPYRISEGEADRPALYVSGSGILNDPTEVHVSTGAKNAREGFDNVFESPFIAGVRETYDTAAAMAHQYSASVAEVQYELPNSFETPTGLGQFPAGVLVTDNLRNYRIQDASQTHSKVSGNAVAYTTIGAYVASYPAGATLRDEKARHAGRTIRKFNIKPLKGDA